MENFRCANCDRDIVSQFHVRMVWKTNRLPIQHITCWLIHKWCFRQWCVRSQEAWSWQDQKPVYTQEGGV